jgi:mono/diheme cytochrome c family protein
MKRNGVVALVAFTILSSLIEHGYGQANSSQIAFTEVSQIFDRRCTACHNADGAPGAADLNLEAESSSAIVERTATEAPLPLISPGDPDKSYLFAKLTGNQSKVGGSGETMPAGQGRLAPDQLDLIRHWILQGARVR